MWQKYEKKIKPANKKKKKLKRYVKFATRLGNKDN